MKLKIENLCKTYRNGVRALRDVNLEIGTGMFGLLGPNGAGKSTLMRTLATLQEAGGGRVFLDDIDVLESKDEVRRLLGYLPQDFGVYPEVSAQHMLNHIALLKGIANKKERKDIVSRLLVQTNLYDARKRKLGGYSGGMKQRFGIAQALLGSPQLLIVDEPTAGLDPEERNRFHNLLSEISENIIIILSTHIVDDVRQLCNNMAVLHQGEVLLSGTPAEAIAVLEGKIWGKIINKKEFPEYQKNFNMVLSRLTAGKMLIHVFSEKQPEQGFEPARPELEDVYFSTIKNGFNSAV